MIRIGHRGAAGHVLENTLGSIEKAIELGVDYVEIDLRLTRDGHIVVLHDATVDRTTRGHGRIKDLTLAQVKRLKTKDGQHVPMLEDVLKLTDGRVGLMLELKVRGLAKPVTEIVERSGFSSPLIYASFNHSELARIRQILPKVNILALFEKGPILAKTLVATLHPTHVGIRRERITKRSLNAAQAAGLHVFVYTVNDVEDIRRMTAMGVDGTVSDCPGQL
jgi:glycerophosphoryl diester phosphodiesterase